MENLEYNQFFNALQGEFHSQFEDAQLKGFAVFIPTSNSLRNVVINKEFVGIHLGKPSPYFQGDFIVYDGYKEKVVKIENNVARRFLNFEETSDVKIIGEEVGYNKNGKAFRIYIIEQPFQTFGLLESDSDRLKEASINQSWIDGSECPSVAQCKTFISSFGDGNVLNELDKDLQIVLKNYLFLSDYLTEIGDMLRKLIDSTIEKILRNQLHLGPKTITVLPICIEGYVLNTVHNVLFPIICRRFQQEDEKLSLKLLKLHQAEVTPSQLGAPELFSCPVPASVVELARLPSLTTPKMQLQCVKNTMDLISAEIKQHMLESRGFLSFTDGLPCSVTADDLIPALSTVIIKSKLRYLTANCFYMENFSWSVSVKDVYGYSLTSFKAAIEFLKNLKTHQLPPSTSNLKKELSLEELMEVTCKLEREKNNDNVTSSRPKSSVDRQMEKIAKMIEASTRELTQVQHKGFSGF